MGKNPPRGVIIVAVLTLLGSMGDFYFSIVWVALSASGHPGTYVGPPPISWWIVLCNSLLLSIISVVASIGMLKGARYVWHLSIILWVFSAIHYCYAASLIFRRENLMIMAGSAILVNSVLILYFQSKQVKDYFFKVSNQLTRTSQAKVIKHPSSVS